MSTRSAWLRHVRRALSERLDRLHLALESLTEKLRESVALAVGQAVGGAVHDAVQAALEGHATGPLAGRHYTPVRERESMWDDERPWRQDSHDYPPEEEYDAEGEGEYGELAHRSAPGQPRRQRGLAALAAGLQACAWLLRRPDRRASFWPTVCVGLLAAVTVYVAGPLLASPLHGLVRLGGALASAAAALTALRAP
jgi:hypothetical protein